MILALYLILWMPPRVEPVRGPTCQPICVWGQPCRLCAPPPRLGHEPRGRRG